MELKERLVKLVNSFLESNDKGIKIKDNVEDIKMTDLNFNSIEFIELIVELEEEFNCEFDDSLLSNNSFLSLNSLIEYLSKIAN